MKNSKIKVFVVWLMAIAFLFSNLPIRTNVYADETRSGGSQGKDISDRVKWYNDKTNLWVNRAGEALPIILNGKMISKPPAIYPNNTLSMEYHWEIDADAFLGNPDDETDDIQPGDTFRLELIDSQAFRNLVPKPPKNEEYPIWDRSKTPHVQYGTFTFKYKSGNSGPIELVATFNENIKGYNSLENGYFKFEALIGEGDQIKIGTDKDNPLTLPITPRSNDVHVLNINTMLVKNGDYVAKDGRIIWHMPVAFDELVSYFKDYKYTEAGTEKPGNIKHRKDIVLYDFLPKGVSFTSARMRVTLYSTVPESRPNLAATPGHLSSGHIRSSDIQFPNTIEETGSGIESIDPFIEKIRVEGREQPTLGVLHYQDLENEKRTLVVVGLGESPSQYQNDYGKYSTLAKLLPGIGDLSDFIRSSKIEQDQIERMISKYVGDAQNDGKVRAWNIVINANVEKIDKRYENVAYIQWLEPEPPSSDSTGGSGTSEPKWIEKEHSASSLVSYAAAEGGVTVVPRTSFVVRKEWKGKTADKVEFDILADGQKLEGHRRKIYAPDWRVTVTGLPLYNSDGKTPINYMVKEVPLEGYTTSVAFTKDQSGNISRFTITNTDDKKDKVDVKVSKVWDGNPQDSVKVTLLGKVDNKETVRREATIYPQDNWVYTFRGLPKKDDKDKLIVYSVEENQVTGYEVPDVDDVDSDASDNLYEFRVTNKEIQNIKKTNIVINKKWQGNPQNEAVFTLHAEVDGKTREVDTVTLGENKWSHTFNDLATEDEKKNPVTYSVTERPIYGYVPKEEKTIIDGLITFNITNIEQQVGDIAIPVKKIWKNHNGDNLKKEEITVEAVTVVLEKQGSSGQEEVARLELKADDWSGVFNVPKAHAGADIIYSVKEIAVEGYDVKVEKQGDGYLITNTKKEKQDDSTVKPETTPPTSEQDKEEETTARTTESSAASSTKVTTATTENAAEQTTAETTSTAEEETEETTEATTETTSRTAVETTTEEETTTASSPIIVTTTSAPTTVPTTTRTFEFIDIAEDVPLGVRTTAPIDLELVLIEEAVPLSGLPYTASIPFELFVGFGMLILTIGLTLGRRL